MADQIPPPKPVTFKKYKGLYEINRHWWIKKLVWLKRRFGDGGMTHISYDTIKVYHLGGQQDFSIRKQGKAQGNRYA